MIVFCLPQHRAMLPSQLDERSDPALRPSRSGRFPDGELWVELDGPVSGAQCTVLGSLAPPDSQMLSTLLLADTLKRAGARRVVGLLPYLGYARQDRAAAGRSRGAAWAGALLAAAGIDEVVTVDIHSGAAQAAFPCSPRRPTRAPARHATRGRPALAASVDELGDVLVLAHDEVAVALGDDVLGVRDLVAGNEEEQPVVPADLLVRRELQAHGGVALPVAALAHEAGVLERRAIAVDA